MASVSMSASKFICKILGKMLIYIKVLEFQSSFFTYIYICLSHYESLLQQKLTSAHPVSDAPLVLIRSFISMQVQVR